MIQQYMYASTGTERDALASERPAIGDTGCGLQQPSTGATLSLNLAATRKAAAGAPDLCHHRYQGAAHAEASPVLRSGLQPEAQRPDQGLRGKLPLLCS